MKCLITVVLILSAAAAGFGQQNPVGFATGQSARLVIGQPEFDAELDSASQTILGGVSGLAYANKTLFVVDSNIVGAPPVNNRVMIYPTGQLPAPNAAMQYNTLCPVCVGQASLVLGQPDWVSILPAPCILPPANVTVTTTPTTPACLASSPQTPTATGMNTPTAVASDGTHLVVADTNNNRVLIWKSIPVNMNQPPDLVVGQTSFTTAVFPGDTPTATSLRGPEGVWIQNGQLFIADTQNQRVLIYNSIPTSNGAAADIVLGQPNMTTWVQVNIADQNTSATASNMLTPVSVTSDGTRLFVTDVSYNRVLIWNTIPTTNQQPADVEIGQPNMTQGYPDNAAQKPPPRNGGALHRFERWGREHPPDIPATLRIHAQFPEVCAFRWHEPVCRRRRQRSRADLHSDTHEQRSGGEYRARTNRLCDRRPNRWRGYHGCAVLAGLGWKQLVRGGHLQPARPRLHDGGAGSGLQRSAELGQRDYLRHRSSDHRRHHQGRRHGEVYDRRVHQHHQPFLPVHDSKRRHLYVHRGWTGGGDQRQRRRSERHRHRGYKSR